MNVFPAYVEMYMEKNRRSTIDCLVPSLGAKCVSWHLHVRSPLKSFSDMY